LPRPAPRFSSTRISWPSNTRSRTRAATGGFDQIPGTQRFDLIAANLPAKVGRELLSILLTDASRRLRVGGRLYVVTISGLRRFIERAMREVFGSYEKVKQGKSYTVARARVEEAFRER
jgi:16S rRNA G1207 methylase RsmC